MSKTWDDAAAQYAQRILKSLHEVPAAMPITPPTTKPDNTLEIAQAAISLHEFMNSEEGDRATNLLNWSNRCVIFAQYDQGGYGAIFYLDAEGFHRCSQAVGAWVASSSQVTRPKIKNVSANVLVEAAVQYGGKKPSDIISWLRAELDKIAAAAPSPTEP